MTDIGRSRRAWRQAFFVLLGIAVITIGGLLIAVADKKVSYAGESNDSARQEMLVLTQLIEDQQPPATRATVLRTLRRQNPKARIFATDTTVTIGRLTFVFARAGRLERVIRGDQND